MLSSFLTTASSATLSGVTGALETMVSTQTFELN
jgi:hypothetical protein